MSVETVLRIKPVKKAPCWVSKLCIACHAPCITDYALMNPGNQLLSVHIMDHMKNIVAQGMIHKIISSNIWSSLESIGQLQTSAECQSIL